ncbi:hypothetical protein CVIRNUC_001082 [Coccomyxa viridis]|uniref:Uncharacterized protein n=1 Tax=Coccomyxa viridis TaxID=1274662 RepID=A0AAV1HUZ4_9CHLO|nr:hypothetical protein CVIRNUC_001082 [Coccomyxa viridis]
MSTTPLQEAFEGVELDPPLYDDNLLSMLEYGADPKEMDQAGFDEVCKAHAARDIPDFMPERSRHMELGQKAQQGRTPAAAAPQGYAAAHAEKERQAKGGVSPTLSERQRLIPAWKPTDEARPAHRSRGTSSASPGSKGSAQKPRAAWGAGPAAQPPPMGRRPSKQPLGQPAPAAAAPQQGALRKATGGKLSVNAALPRRFPCSLDPSPSSSSGASTGAGGAASRELGKAGSATARRASSSSEGGAGQLVASRAASGRWGPASVPGSALDLGVLQAQVRSKNRVIADLRTQKQQLSEELEGALTENQQLKQRVGQGERLKEQHEGLLGMLRQARAELDQALEGRQQAQAAMEPLQQRVRAMSAKAAVSRETEHKMAIRMMEKNQMLDQLYNTLKQLKQEFEASRQEAAEATQGLQQAHRQVQQHFAAVQEANKLQEGASAALMSLSLRCEKLAETAVAESAARQAAEVALDGTQKTLQDSQGQLRDAERQLGDTAADLQSSRRRAEGLERELQSMWDAAEAQRAWMAELQEDLTAALEDGQEQHDAAAALAKEVDALRARLAGFPGEDVLEETDLDLELPAFMGESRAQLMRSQELMRGQLVAEGGVMAAGAVSGDAIADEGAQAGEVGHQSPSTSQEGVVQSAKEAFEAMSGSGGWSVYNNKAARRISDGGHSSGHTQEASL